MADGVVVELEEFLKSNICLEDEITLLAGTITVVHTSGWLASDILYSYLRYPYRLHKTLYHDSTSRERNLCRVSSEYH